MGIIFLLITTLILIIIIFQQYKSKGPINVFLLMALISIPIISVLVLSLAVFSEVNFVQQPNTIFIWITGFIVYMNIWILYLYLSLKNYYEKLELTRIEKKVFESELKYFKQLKDSQAKLYAMKHDLKNEHVVLLGMLNEKDIAGAKDYLEQSIEKIARTEYFFTHNYVLTFIIVHATVIPSNFLQTSSIPICIVSMITSELFSSNGRTFS